MERRNKAVLAHNSQLLFKYSGGSEFTLNFIKCVGFYIGFQNPIQVLTSYPLTKGTKNHPFYFSMAVFFQLQRALESPGRLVQTLVAEPHVRFPVCQSSVEPEICISHKFPGGAGPLRPGPTLENHCG